MNTSPISSTRPYLIRALYEWCTDNGFTPYVAVMVDESVQVPREYVRNGEIVLNISFDATSSLKLGNEFIEFKARFAGVARDILVPVERVIAIYARENGQGMAFPVASAPTHAGPQMVGLGPVGMPQPGPAVGAFTALESSGHSGLAGGDDAVADVAGNASGDAGNAGDAGEMGNLGNAGKVSPIGPVAEREARPVHLVPSSAGSASASQPPKDEPPKPSGGSRPSLKRVK